MVMRDEALKGVVFVPLIGGIPGSDEEHGEISGRHLQKDGTKNAVKSNKTTGYFAPRATCSAITQPL